MQSGDFEIRKQAKMLENALREAEIQHRAETKG